MQIKQIKQNMTEVEFRNGIKILYSYRTPVAAWIPNKGFIKTETKYSNTTTKHINEWIRKESEATGNANSVTRPQHFFNDLVINPVVPSGSF